MDPLNPGDGSRREYHIVLCILVVVQCKSVSIPFFIFSKRKICIPIAFFFFRNKKCEELPRSRSEGTEVAGGGVEGSRPQLFDGQPQRFDGQPQLFDGQPHLYDSRIEVAGGREVVAKSRSTRRRRTYRYQSNQDLASRLPVPNAWLPMPNGFESELRIPIQYLDLFSGFCGLKYDITIIEMTSIFSFLTSLNCRQYHSASFMNKE